MSSAPPIRLKYSKRRKRPSVQAVLPGEVMAPLFKRLKLDEQARGYRALLAFHQAAGTAITGRARAEALRGRILYVRVVSSAWSQQLHALKSEILAKLARTPGGEGIDDMRFRVGPLGEAPDWEAADEADPVPVPERPRRVVTTPPPGEVTRALADVTDEELRDTLAQLYTSLKSQAPRADD